MCDVHRKFSISFTIKCNDNEFQDKHQTAAAAADATAPVDDDAVAAASPSHLQQFQETTVLKFLQNRKFQMRLLLWLFVCVSFYFYAHCLAVRYSVCSV